MANKALSVDQVEEFMHRGFTLLRGAFSPATAAACRARLWAEMAAKEHDPSTWTQPVVHLKVCYGDGPFGQAISRRYLDACDDLMGEGRYVPTTALGWWPVSFPGFDAPPWRPPETGWHVDGIQFHHHIDSEVQGLLPLFLFSDIAPGGGGTVLAVGSHRITARVLRDSEPDGLDVHELTRRVAAAPRGEVVEITGSAGDIALSHPFILHARGPNTSSSVRFICNPCVSFRQRMNIFDPCQYQSPVERSIAEALIESGSA